MRRLPEPSLRESVFIFALMFSLLALALSGNPHEAQSPDFKVASR